MFPTVIYFRIESKNNECHWLLYLISSSYYYEVIFQDENNQNLLLFELDIINGLANHTYEVANIEKLTEQLNCTVSEFKQIIEAPFQNDSKLEQRTHWQVGSLNMYLENDLYNSN